MKEFPTRFPTEGVPRFGRLQTSVSSTLPLNIDFTALEDGALPSPLVGSTWSIVGGKAVNTPSKSSDIVANGSMETGNPPTGWAVQGTPTIYEQSAAQAYDGVNSLHVVANAATQGGKQTITPIDGEFYDISVRRYRVSGTSQVVFTGAFATNLSSSGFTGTWAEFNATEAAASSSADIYLRMTGGAGESYFDAAKVRLLPKADIMALIDAQRADASVQGAWTITANYQAGVVARVDNASSPQNLIRCYHNRTNLIVRKLVNGVWSAPLLNTPATYAAGAKVRLDCSGVTVKAYYNDVQVGSDLTVSDASIVNNTLHGLLSSNAANLCASLAVSPL